MNKLALLKYTVLVLSIFLSYQAVEAHDKSFPEDGTYISSKRDVTGDQKIDIIQVQGTPYNKESKFLKEIELLVESNRQSINVPLEAGYKPELALADLNKDGVQDVLVTVLTEGIERTVNSYAYTFKDGKARDLEVPPSVPVTAQFLDGYKAEVMIEGNKPIIVDVSSRKKEYEELGIYQDGKLNESTELLVNSYSSLKPKTFFGKGKGLSGVQYVMGSNERDPLLEIKSFWSFNHGWELIKTDIKPIKKK
ncbi:hypothetical protein [Peribacillus sp. NPDC097295]|uniref:hypothetical protein n=1 Tax=Peribacillus sp. NPDC097295 TaxID=3364402 RepID=UPI00380C4A43